MSLHYGSYTQDLIVSGHLSPEKFSAIDDVLDCNPSSLPKSVLDSERREWVATLRPASPLPLPSRIYLPNPAPQPRYLPRFHLLPANSLGAGEGVEGKGLGLSQRKGLRCLAYRSASRLIRHEAHAIFHKCLAFTLCSLRFLLIGICLYGRVCVNSLVNISQSISPHTQGLYILVEALLTHTHSRIRKHTRRPREPLDLP